jgi:myo-inositol-hexaphosphate 3-phosphohydrolase
MSDGKRRFPHLRPFARRALRWKLVAVAFVAAPLVLHAWGAAALTSPVSVCPTVETAAVHSSGDAADDSAIWIHSTDPSLSTLIGTDKSTTGGLNVYDLSGRELYFKADGRLNNDDVRYNFPLGSSRVAIVGATNRVARTLDFYKVNDTDRSLTKVGSVPVSSAITTPRGFALYHSPTSGKYYAFVTDSGKTEQYELSGASGQVTGTLVRKLATISNATEGLVADDELGRLYIAEEDIGGVWRFGAEPTDPTTGVRFATTTENGGPIKQDVKGLTIYYASNGRGYIIAASQGASSFHIFNRGDNAYVGEFKIAACNGIDAVTGEDGIDVTNFNLGPLFPQGFFTSTDYLNDGANQNHKLVPWQSIANSFNPPLVIDASFDPRKIGASPSGPDTLIDSGPSGTVGSASATFSFSSSLPSSTFQCKLDASSFTPCTSPTSYSGLVDGSHTFQVRATDTAGNTDPTPATRSWTVDTTAPDTTITSGPNDPTSATSASFTFSSTEAGSTFGCSLDGGAFAPCSSPASFSGLTSGTHRFAVRAADAAGNQDASAATYTWTITAVTDTTAPAVSLTAPPDGATVHGTVTISAEASDDNAVDHVDFIVGGTVVGTDAAFPYSVGWASTSVSDGSITISARAVDSSANATTSASHAVTVDNTPPDTTITSGPSGTVSSSSASFAFSSNDSGARFECKLDAGAFAACTSPANYSALADGSHTFQARAVDGAGNPDPTPATRTWAIDTTPPAVATVSPADGSTGVAVGANVQATFSEPVDPTTVTTGTFTLTRSGGSAAVAAVVSYDGATKTATLDPTGDLSTSTSYTATVTTAVKDPAGNAIPTSKVWSFITADTVSSGIRREGVATVVNSTATNVIAIPRPAGTAAGDVLVACLALNGGSVSSTGVPSGWAPIASLTAISNPHVFAYYRVAGVFEPTDYRWTLGSSVQSGAGIARYSGVDNVMPLDAPAATASGAAATSATLPGVTTATANAMLVGCMAVNSSSLAVTIASPSGMTEAWDIGGKRHELADGVQRTVGATGPKTWLFSAGREWAGWLTALRPR